jgi:hypothetical protein
MVRAPGSAAGVGPDVPAWMLQSSGPVHRAADGVRSLQEAVGTTGDRLAGLLTDTATALGWRGDAAAGASARAEHAGGQTQRLQDQLGLVRDALTRLAQVMDDYGPGISDLARRRMVLGEKISDASLPHLGDDTGTRPDPETMRAEVAGVDRQLSARVDELAAADRAATAVLADAASLLHALASLQAEDAWVATATDPQVVQLLGHYGVVESAQERGVVEAAMFLPNGPDGDRQLRAMLNRLTPDQIADLLERHPDLARRLTSHQLPAADTLPPGPEAGLAGVLANSHGLPPKERIAAVRAWFATLTPDQARRLALLYPGVVGNLDGAPLADRVAANRVQIAVALDDELAQRARLEIGVAKMGSAERWWAAANDNEYASMAVRFSDPASAMQSNQHRIGYYNNLLYEHVDNPVRRKGGPDVVEHQVLFFDPRGDGKIAEIWGPLDADTRHVAVFVPGMSSDMDSFGGYSDKMLNLAKDDRDKRTTTVTWMGMDCPNDLNQAAMPVYAETGGPALRDFVWGLGIPPTADTTVIGHSYGGATVGVADREGLETNRVLLIEPAGAGRNVWSLNDYHEAETGRHIDHYTMTAPGDLIHYSQESGRKFQDATGAGHGGNPQTMPGFTVLDTGYFDDTGASHGELISGPKSHTDVLEYDRRTTAWRHMADVVAGRTTPHPIQQEPSPTATPTNAPPTATSPAPHPATTPSPAPGTAPEPGAQAPQPQPLPTGTP